MSKAKAFLQLVADAPPPCSEVGDPELFFPSGWGENYDLQIAEAKAVCRRCPLITECMGFALETDDQHGILAGTTPAERSVFRRQLSEQATLNELGARREFENERKSWRSAA